MSLTNSRRRAVAATALLGSLALAVPALTTTATAAPAAKAGPVDRISGADRYEVSAAISRLNFDPNVDVAYVASGEVFTDALTGAPVAGKGGSPVLLTRSDVLPQVIADELTRLAPKKIVVFGGTNSVTGAVTNALKKIQPNLERVAAPTRYSTSAKISSLNYAVGPDTAFVASGEVYTDALSGAPVAGKTPGPLVLIEKDNVPGVVKKELERLASKRIVVLGGENTIDADTYSFLTRYTSGAIERWAGADRFATSAEVSKRSYAPGVHTVYVASGRTFPDALSGASVAGKNGNPVLLVDTNSIPATIGAELDRLNPRQIIILGGPASVSSAVEAQLAQYITG